MPLMYSLTDSVATFFSRQTDTTREECDSLAALLLSAGISPVSIQGTFSYTLADHSRLAQFRRPDSPLDVEVLRRARSTHGPLVPDTAYHGKIGQDRPLLIYIIERLPGITYMEYQLTSGLHQSLSEERYEKQRTLVEDFARFFAASWKTPYATDTTATRQTFVDDLDLLAQTLPSRFSREILKLLDCLDSIFESLPIVLTHGDLCEMNFLVDEDSAHLTGIIDWAEAEVLPFGLSLWGLENILGYMDVHDWHYFDRHAELRALFWKTFHIAVSQEDETWLRKQDAIDSARRMGILFRYGFSWDEDLQRRVVQDGDSGTKYLDALFH